MPNVADIELIHRLAVGESGGPEPWARLDQSERSRTIYAVMRRLDLAGIITPAVSEAELN